MSPLNHKDFRSGNLVKFDGRIFEIDTIAKEFPTLNTIEFGIGVVDWNNIEPIPLSEDVLIKLGFESYFEQFTNGLLYIKFDGEDIQIKITESENWYITPLKYAHEIQNLNFALFKLELIYTP